jgi:ABC-type transport system involved in cytochrome bd biosynthesis fused ATPase/permease subunit
VSPSPARGHLREHTEPPRTVPLPPGPYELRLAGLRARWPDGEPDGEMVTLGDVELVLPPGRRAALVASGPVGASALAAVLLGFLDYEGTVTLNDVELRDLPGEDVRAVIGLCARDTRILGATVADNVRVARPDATDDDVAGALRRAGVDLPPEAVVGDRDGTLSAAARQRLALARVLLADQPVLILEEPTEEPGMLTDLLSAAEDRTLLLLTHGAAVPGAAPILRHVDEVVTLSGR